MRLMVVVKGLRGQGWGEGGFGVVPSCLFLFSPYTCLHVLNRGAGLQGILIINIGKLFSNCPSWTIYILSLIRSDSNGFWKLIKTLKN